MHWRAGDDCLKWSETVAGSLQHLSPSLLSGDTEEQVEPDTAVAHSTSFCCFIQYVHLDAACPTQAKPKWPGPV